MEVGRFKAGPFHSERRLSQSSQVLLFHIFQGILLNRNRLEKDNRKDFKALNVFLSDE